MMASLFKPIRCAWFWPNKSFLVSLHKKLFPKVITIFQEGKCICQSRLKIMSFEQRSLSRTVTLVNRFIKHRAYHRMWHIFCIWQIRNNIIQHNVRDFLVFSDKHSLQSYFSRYFPWYTVQSSWLLKTAILMLHYSCLNCKHSVFGV